ncbi:MULTISPECIES: polymer-forming cytoskeletal protein [unclassified Pseudomonas]|uniref:polymer-forming cytoskeletal protein n=1 Tax=unclassified Pseudomonas TaxID=196821 RepID=UPI0023D83AB3|nr:MULTISPECIES: polymer-forming cytoskeletal protein [unclassified Pseudomonas]MED5606655.1 polymer-forming cytoskeletal protein [Pseudomonas sp. JH-2]
MNAPSRQRGAATILTVLVSALALGVIALSLIFSVRGNQDRQVAAQAASQSQAGAWSGVEVFRRYFLKLAEEDSQLPEDESRLARLAVGDEREASLGSNALTLKIIDVEPPGEAEEDRAYSITADLRNRHAVAQAATLLRVVYQVTPGSAPGPENGGVIDIHGDLNASGDIDIQGEENAKLNVDGSATLKGSVNGVEALRATKDITLEGNASVGEAYANGTLTLKGSASVLKGSALGGIAMQSGAQSGELNTNGNLLIDNGRVETGNALGEIRAGGSGYGSLIAGRTLTLRNGMAETANAVGNIAINAWLNVRTINSRATITCPAAGWTTFDSIRALAVSNCPAIDKVQAPAEVSFELMAKLEPYVMPQKPTVDAYTLKAGANYVFEFAAGQRRVTVRNVNGLADGEYFLGNYSHDGRGWRDFLCLQVDTSANCLDPAPADRRQARTICQGHASEQGCLSYDSRNRKWTLAGKSLAPGVLWFEGDLHISNGNYHNSFLSTRSISTGGQVVVSAVNYSDFKFICSIQYPHIDFTGLYPSNLCDMAKDKLKSNSIGNIGLLAGGVVDGQLQGGDITLGSQSEINGSVIAGNRLSATGDSKIRGYITAAGWGEGSSDFLNDLELDLANLPPDYRPEDIPGMGSCLSNCDVKASARAKWVRYL